MIQGFITEMSIGTKTTFARDLQHRILSEKERAQYFNIYLYNTANFKYSDIATFMQTSTLLIVTQ